MYAVELREVLALVQQDFAVGVVDDRLLDDGRRDDVVHLLRHHDRLAEILANGFKQIPNICTHIGRGEGLPALLDKDHLADAFQPPHLRDEGLHDDERHHRQQRPVRGDVVQLEDDETLVQQIQLFVGVQQVVVLAALIVRFQHVQEVFEVEILLPHALLLQKPPVVGFDELVKGIERGDDGAVGAELREVEVHGVRERYLLRACWLLGFPFPKGQQQRLERLALLHVVHSVLDIEGIEGDGRLLGVGEIHPVAAFGLGVNQRAEPLVGVARIDQQDMRSLLPVLTNQMVRQITLARARRPEDKFIPIRDDAALHRKVRDVQMERYARQAVGHLDSEGRERRAVVGLLVEKAEGLIEKGVETLLGGEVGLVAGNRRPEQHRHVHRVVMRRAAHKGQLRAHVVADALQLRFALGPCHDVAMAPYGAQPLRMRLIEIHFDPLPVDGVRARIARQRVHVPGRGFEALERFVVVVEEDHLIVDMVAGEQQPHGRREREAAVRAVGRKAFVAEIRRHALWQHIQIGERVHRKELVSDAHHARVETDIFVDDRTPLVREGEVTGQQPGVVCRADDLRFR